ncbi:MAG: hypothetical protein COA73_13530 [Candidatus Hydrogenedentota bacterium]|nr:MAG: hypothetical protein COA73_13530 [Candidatus Hydrogenedentota bacterium]
MVKSQNRKSLDWEALVDKDMPEIGPITKEFVKRNMKYPHRIRGTVRLGRGLIWTEEELSTYRKEVLEKPLP